MNNLREHLEDKYITNRNESYSVKEIAEEVINLLNVDKENYIDVTGFDIIQLWIFYTKQDRFILMNSAF